MRMKADQIHSTGCHNFVEGIPGLAVFVVKAKTVPHWVNAGIHVYTDGYAWTFFDGFGEFYNRVKFVEVVDVDERFVLNGFGEVVDSFIGSVKDNPFSGYPVFDGFIVFEARNNFGPRAFLMINITNGIHVVCLVRPGKLYFGIPCAECFFCPLVSVADGFFGYYKKW